MDDESHSYASLGITSARALLVTGDVENVYRRQTGRRCPTRQSRMKGRRKKRGLPSGVDPEDLRDASIIIGAYFGKGAVKTADRMAQLIDEFGEDTRQIWEAAFKASSRYAPEVRPQPAKPNETPPQPSSSKSAVPTAGRPSDDPRNLGEDPRTSKPVPHHSSQNMDGLPMNRKQFVALWIGIGIVILMILLPPWKEGMGSYGRSYSAGYGLLFFPPNRSVGIDLERLALQLFAVALVTAGAIVSFRPCRNG